jgi:hypothetical protein
VTQPRFYSEIVDQELEKLRAWLDASAKEGRFHPGNRDYDLVFRAAEQSENLGHFVESLFASVSECTDQEQALNRLEEGLALAMIVGYRLGRAVERTGRSRAPREPNPPGPASPKETE